MRLTKERCKQHPPTPILATKQKGVPLHGYSPQFSSLRFEAVAKVAKLPGCKICEVPVSYFARTVDEGKKIRFKDAFFAVYCIIRYNLFCSLKGSFTSLPKLIK